MDIILSVRYGIAVSVCWAHKESHTWTITRDGDVHHMLLALLWVRPIEGGRLLQLIIGPVLLGIAKL